MRVIAAPSAVLVLLMSFLLSCFGSGGVTAQPADKIARLKRNADELSKAGKYTDALAIAREALTLAEQADTISSGKPGPRTADALGTLAWHALFARMFDESLASSKRALVLEPDLVWLETNRAHALLFLGRIEEARAIYIAHKGKRVDAFGRR